MDREVILSCACGQVALRITGRHIASVECCCTSCRAAGDILNALPMAKPPVDDKGATRYVMQRKDHVKLLRGGEQLREFRLAPDSKTRRVVAVCCNTPILAEFQGGHWFSLYGSIWPVGTLPPLELRTMCGDLPAGTQLPNDVTNARTHTFKFYAQLFAAWVGMGFRAPRFDVVKGALNVPR